MTTRVASSHPPDTWRVAARHNIALAHERVGCYTPPSYLFGYHATPLSLRASGLENYGGASSFARGVHLLFALTSPAASMSPLLLKMVLAPLLLSNPALGTLLYPE